MNEQHIIEIIETVGYIKGKVEKISDLEKRFDTIDEKVDKLSDRVSGILGWAAGAGAITSLLAYLIKDQFSRMFFGNKD